MAQGPLAVKARIQGSSLGELELENYKFTVQVSGNSIMITCPSETETTLKKDTVEVSKNRKVHELIGVTKGQFECAGKFLYLNTYVCETCTEVSVLAVVIILIADCLVTLGVSLLVYFGCKKKSARNNTLANGGQNRGNKERPPPIPDPDYMPLQKGRRDVYDGLNRKL